jgi:hypothetical protein
LANEPPGTLQHQDTHTSMRHNSTNMDPIQEAVEYLELHDGEEQLLYRQVAIIFGVD